MLIMNVIPNVVVNTLVLASMYILASLAGNAQCNALLGTFQMDLLTVDEIFSAIGGMDTGKNLNERGFSCAVFAAQGMHLALPDVKGHAVQRTNTGEYLYNVLALDDGFHFRQFGYLQSGFPANSPKAISNLRTL